MEINTTAPANQPLLVLAVDGLAKGWSKEARASAVLARRNRGKSSGEGPAAGAYADAKSGEEGSGKTPGQRSNAGKTGSASKPSTAKEPGFEHLPDSYTTPTRKVGSGALSADAVHFNYEPPRLTTNSKTSTEVDATAEVDSSTRMKTPSTNGVQVTSSERPVDYGEAGSFMKEKYGNKRGAEMYDKMVDGPSARYFQAGTKIAAEKKAMMLELGKEGSIRNHHYQGLHSQWISKQK